MPDVQNVVSMPWKGTPGAVQNVVSMPWKAAASPVQSLGGAYTPPAAPGGGTPTTPGDLRAAKALAPATSYVQAHAASVVDVRTGLDLEVDSLTISLQDDSIFWQLSASGQDSLFATLTTGEQPVVVEATIDGRAWRFLVENVSRPRSAESRRVQFGGRSVAAVADKPFAFPANYAIAAPTTAAQLVAGALQAAGVELEWKLEDWLIPAGTVSLTGTPLEIARAVANAVGATVTAHDSELKLTIESRYPAMPNEWAATAPDVQIHSRAVRTESYERSDQPAYTGVIVAGQQGGALGYARLEGTSGAELAPLVSDPLLTDSAALRERARSILAAGGSKATVTRTLPVRTGAGEPGVLRRGALVRCVDQTDGTEIWHGMVRSVSVRAQLPVVDQTVSLERYTQHVVMPDTSPALEIEAVPDQEAQVATAYSLDLTAFRSGGAPPYVWTMRSGTLPAGLSLSGETIAGTPSAVGGPVDLQLRVTDSVSRQLDTNVFSLEIVPDHRLLTLTFEDSLTCLNTTEAFTSAGTFTYDASGFAGKAGRFHGATSSTSRVQSTNQVALWDLQGATHDWTIGVRFKADSDLPTSARALVTVSATGLNSNQFISMSARRSSNGLNMLVTAFYPWAATFGYSLLFTIPWDTNWHFATLERRGNTLSLSVDGAARQGGDSGTTGGTSWSTSGAFRSTPGARRVTVGNNTVNTAAWRGLIDNLQFIRGTPFDHVAGFTPPAGLIT